jgi:hypothetical protein
MGHWIPWHENRRAGRWSPGLQARVLTPASHLCFNQVCWKGFLLLCRSGSAEIMSVKITTRVRTWRYSACDFLTLWRRKIICTTHRDSAVTSERREGVSIRKTRQLYHGNVIDAECNNPTERIYIYIYIYIYISCASRTKYIWC